MPSASKTALQKAPVIKYMTDGILLRSPTGSGPGSLQRHHHGPRPERSLNTDVLFGLLREVRVQASVPMGLGVSDQTPETGSLGASDRPELPEASGCPAVVHRSSSAE